MASGRKSAVIRAALALHRPDPSRSRRRAGRGRRTGPCGHDRRVSSACAAAHIPAVVDGFISDRRSAVRRAPLPGCAGCYLFLSHASYEIGYRIALRRSWALTPFLQLGMRLGEGSGCPLAFQVLKAACAVMNGMATFAEAAINDDYLDVHPHAGCRSAWTRHENFTGRRQQKRKKRPCAAALPSGLPLVHP